MRQASEKTRPASAFGTTDVGERTCAFLRRMYPARTADNVAADLCAWGVKNATVAKMLERQTAPGAILWVAMTCAYGPEFLTAVLPATPDWLDAAKRAERQRTYEQKMAALKMDYEDLQ